MATMIEPCPFCESQHLHITHHLMSHSVCCQSCKGCGPHKQQLEDAIREWNLASRLSVKAKITENLRLNGRLHELEDAVRNLASELRCV